MRINAATAGLALIAFALLIASPARGDLLHPPSGGSSYPDIEGAMNGSQSYTFNSATQTGVFQYSDTPFALLLGPKSSDEYDIQPNSNGTRAQTLSLVLNQNGQVVNSPTNTYSLYGTVVVGGQTFNGLLLQATPTAFGSQSGSATTFDMNMTVTGGALAQAFGPDLYLQLHPSLNSTFDGSFNHNFTTAVVCSSVVGPNSPNPSPVPEPATIVVLIACGAGFFANRRFRRTSLRDLEPLQNT
jgi:hypothetical protein